MVVEFGVAREVRRLPEGFTPLFWVCTLVESCAVVAQGRGRIGGSVGFAAFVHGRGKRRNWKGVG